MLIECKVVVEDYFVIHKEEMTSTMKTKAVLTKVINLLLKNWKKLVNREKIYLMNYLM